MFFKIVLIIVYIVEMFAAYIFFSQAGERKYKKIYCYLIGLGLYFSAFAVNIGFNSSIWLNVIYFTLINIAFGYLCFKIKLDKVIIYSFILVAINIVTEYGVEFIVSSIMEVVIKSYISNNTILLYIATIGKSLYFLCALILGRFFARNNSVKTPITFYIYPLSTLIGACICWYVGLYSQINSTLQMTLGIVFFMFLVTTIFFFITYQNHLEKESELFQLKNEMDKIEIEKNYYNILEQQNQNLMIYAHDTKKHLLTIKNLNDDPKIEEYINIMAENLKSYSQICQSGNQTLDVILNKYTAECNMKNIKFSFDVHLKNLEYVDDYDLVAILGNLLDNALESAQNSQNREISLSTDYRNTYDVLIITNSCDTAPTTSNNKLVTSKDDKKLHGYGIKSVLKTLKKYNGDFDWEYDSHKRIFTSTVMLKNKI